MTTGRINQVAILGHTSGPGAACSDSTLSARLRGRAPPTGLPDPKRARGARGAMEGPRRSRATARPLTDAERPSTGWGAIVRHRAPAATKEGSLARAAAQSPITWKPANTRLNGTMQAATRKHAVDMGHLGPKNVGGGQDPGGTEGRLRPADAAPPPADGRTGPRRFRRRPHRLACNIPGSGRGEARRPPQTRLPRLAPSTAPSRATRRTAETSPSARP